MDFVGHDAFGRRVFLTSCDRFADVADLDVPASPFVLFLGADSSAQPVDVAFAVADAMLARGAVYVLCWGPGAQRLEDLFDEAFVMRTLDSAAPVVMTTSHEEQSLADALQFAVEAARPAAEYEDQCRTMLVVLAQNVHWYNEAQNALEDLLR